MRSTRVVTVLRIGAVLVGLVIPVLAGFLVVGIALMSQGAARLHRDEHVIGYAATVPSGDKSLRAGTTALCTVSRNRSIASSSSGRASRNPCP